MANVTSILSLFPDAITCCDPRPRNGGTSVKCLLTSIGMHRVAGLVSVALRTQLPKSRSRYLLADFLQPKWSPLAYLLCFEKQPETHAQFRHFILSLLHCMPGMQSWKDSVSYLKEQTYILATKLRHHYAGPIFWSQIYILVHCCIWQPTKS